VPKGSLIVELHLVNRHTVTLSLNIHSLCLTMQGFKSVRVISSFRPVHQIIPDRVGQRVRRGVLFVDSRIRFVISHVTYLTWLEGGFQIDRQGLTAIPALRPFATQQSAGHWSRCAGQSHESKGRPWPPVAARIELAPFSPRPAFQRLGTHRRQCRVILPKAKSAFVAAMEDVLAVYMRPRDSDRVGMAGR
jgi:hypothetical protein